MPLSFHSDWVVCSSLSLIFFYLFKHEVVSHIVQSLGILDCHSFSSMMYSGLGTSSDTSLRTLGCILSGHMDLCTFMLLRSQTWSSPTVGGSSFSWYLPLDSVYLGYVTRMIASEDWGKNIHLVKSKCYHISVEPLKHFKLLWAAGIFC